MACLKNRLTILLLLLTVAVMGQRKPARVSGIVVDETERPLSGISITILGGSSGVTTTDSGTFQIKVPSEKAFALVFTATGRRTEQRNFFLSPGEQEQVTVRMVSGTTTLEEVVVSSSNDRREVGLVRVNPRNALVIPSATGGVESLIEHRASIEGPGTPCPPDLLRLSVGVEEARDLFDDLDQALRRAHNA